jgi:predicted AlkP superfamily phosphohydrolase/phosphomutase
MSGGRRRLNRREFLKESSVAAAALAAFNALPAWAAGQKPAPGKKVIVLGFDGMDPGLAEQMMDAGELPAMAVLRQAGGYRRLATSIPPQTPVAFASFITGADPGVHGIFDFIHRNPEKQCEPMFSAAGMSLGCGYWHVGDYKLQLTVWPFSHQAPHPELYRHGIPFWDYLDEAGVPTCVYEIPSNFPPSPSKHGRHRSLAGLGTPDMLGTYGTYQHFAENGPYRPREEGGGMRSRLVFKNQTASAKLIGPTNTFLDKPEPAAIAFLVHRDREANAALIEIQEHKLMLKAGQWSPWVRVQFDFRMPSFVPNEHQHGICRFYLQEVAPIFRLYATPVNIDPTDPALPISVPEKFVSQIAAENGLFYTAGFQEDHKALSNKVFTDEEYVQQTDLVLDERMELLDYALRHFQDGLLFFYFACTDLQAHMFWWDTDEKHPVRSSDDARKYHEHVKSLYQKMDRVLGDILKRYGDQATVIAMSDHGFAHFSRQFNLNTWLRQEGYVQPAGCTSLLTDADWSRTRAYGLGLNSLYLNLKGRERDGIVDPGMQREALLRELVEKLEAVRDVDGRPVIRKVYRTDQAYHGPYARLAPDLIVGYHRGFRSSWDTSLGTLTPDVLSDNEEAWSADHCLAAEDVPGVLFANQSIPMEGPNLVDLAPSILAEFGLSTPSTMTGKNVFEKPTAG